MKCASIFLSPSFTLPPLWLMVIEVNCHYWAWIHSAGMNPDWKIQKRATPWPRYTCFDGNYDAVPDVFTALECWTRWTASKRSLTVMPVIGKPWLLFEKAGFRPWNDVRGSGLMQIYDSPCSRFDSWIQDSQKFLSAYFVREVIGGAIISLQE